MSQDANQLLSCCLFFTANSLARTVTRMAEDEFGRLGLPPSHAFVLMLAVEQPGISQKELAEKLHLAQSTVSRFVDALIRRGLVEKKTAGKISHVSGTADGQALLEPIYARWSQLYQRLNQGLGQDMNDRLTRMADEAQRALEEKGA